ncbi:hypothetical protein DAA61_38140 [Bradyrhizobium sp. WBAH33]|nr:hypothetical protein DAA61_38140 [Bradyrhizobium sp. WBAH33]QCK08337.1 hypothetical protein DAB18_38075 [Bradyrhizobium sp. WBAH41]
MPQRTHLLYVATFHVPRAVLVNVRIVLFNLAIFAVNLRAIELLLDFVLSIEQSGKRFQLSFCDPG